MPPPEEPLDPAVSAAPEAEPAAGAEPAAATTPDPATGAQAAATTPDPAIGAQAAATTPDPATGAQAAAATPDPATGAEPAAAAAPDPATGAQAAAAAPDPAAASGPICPTCGRQAGPDDAFCEADGTPLGAGPNGGDTAAPTVMVCACGTGVGHDGGDGYCETCGMLLTPAAPPEEGGEEGSAALAPSIDLGGATHVGKSHETDEDAISIGRRDHRGSPYFVLVVCDGVSSSSHGEQASDHAARAAAAVLLDAVDAAEKSSSDTGIDQETGLEAAIAAAHRAACRAEIPMMEGKDPPGTTIVAAVAHDGRIDVGWVGDSRAYLIGPPLSDGSSLTALALTHDHSWANMVVDAGQMTEAEAMRSPYAHAITHCIGPLESPDPEQAPIPSVAHVTAEPGSRLVVCSDGLWNYFPEPTDIADLLASTTPGSDARTIAVDLMHRALAAGGHDDITVAVALL